MADNEDTENQDETGKQRDVIIFKLFQVPVT